MNGDIAGTCARNDINQFPWFSPAGTTRGAILNAVKLAYNPGKLQRDRLYTNRINPVILSPGAGVILSETKLDMVKRLHLIELMFADYLSTLKILFLL